MNVNCLILTCFSRVDGLPKQSGSPWPDKASVGGGVVIPCNYIIDMPYATRGRLQRWVMEELEGDPDLVHIEVDISRIHFCSFIFYS